uniref:MPV17 mitochondrial inner membrane protein like n=1 Tax=Theropithecus gelada TaxID=9565 RepID=A0A8D2FZT4_THEGE
MAGWWPAVSRAARRHPWPTNVLLYGSLFSAGDALQQRLQGGEADWRQTRRVATLVVTFHANFNYVWLGLLERALPGRAPRAVLAKLLWDQVVGAPIAVSAFYTGEGPDSGVGCRSRLELAGLGRSFPPEKGSTGK